MFFGQYWCWFFPIPERIVDFRCFCFSVSWHIVIWRQGVEHSFSRNSLFERVSICSRNVWFEHNVSDLSSFESRKSSLAFGTRGCAENVGGQQISDASERLCETDGSVAFYGAVVFVDLSDFSVSESTILHFVSMVVKRAQRVRWSVWKESFSCHIGVSLIVSCFAHIWLVSLVRNFLKRSVFARRKSFWLSSARSLNVFDANLVTNELWNFRRAQSVTGELVFWVKWVVVQPFCFEFYNLRPRTLDVFWFVKVGFVQGNVHLSRARPGDISVCA